MNLLFNKEENKEFCSHVYCRTLSSHYPKLLSRFTTVAVDIGKPWSCAIDPAQQQPRHIVIFFRPPDQGSKAYSVPPHRERHTKLCIVGMRKEWKKNSVWWPPCFGLRPSLCHLMWCIRQMRFQIFVISTLIYKGTACCWFYFYLTQLRPCDTRSFKVSWHCLRTPHLYAMRMRDRST
jgi:hypothetical protein